MAESKSAKPAKSSKPTGGAKAAPLAVPTGLLDTATPTTTAAAPVQEPEVPAASPVEPEMPPTAVADPAAPQPESPAAKAAKSRKTTVKPTKEPVEEDPAAPPRPGPEAIQKMIEEAAYYLAEKRNFEPGFEQEDWEAAKAAVMAQLGQDR